MAKKKQNSFGNSLEEVDANISAFNAERKAIAEKINSGKKISKEENKRFSELDNVLTDANNARSSFVTDTNTSPKQETTIDFKEVLGDPTKQNAAPVIPNLGVTPQAPVSTVGQNVPGAGQEALGLGASEALAAFGGIGNTEAPVTAPGEPVASAQINPITGQPQNIVPQDTSFVQTPADVQGDALSEFMNAFKPNGNGTVEDAINQAAGVKGAGGLSPTVGELPQIQVNQQDLNIPGNNQILQGNVGGRIIGNQPVFVENGGVTPMAVLNNRRVAQQNAKLAREAERQKIFDAKPPQLKDARFQRGFNEQFNANQDKFIKAAQEEYGDNWDKALKDQTTEIGRAYVNSLANYDFIARIGDQSTDKIYEVNAGMKSGDIVYSPQTMQILNDYEALEGEFLEGNLGGLINLENAYNKLEGGIALDKLLNDQNIDVKGTVTQYASIANNNDNWTTTTQKKTAYEDQLRVLAADLAKNQMGPSVQRGITSEEEIFEHLKSLYGYENIIDKKITSKPTGGGGISIKVNTESTQGEPIEEKVDNINYTAYDTQEVPTGVKSIDAVGLKQYNADGTTSTVDGARNVDIISLQLVKIIDPNNKKNFKWEKVAVGTHKEKNTFGNEETVTKIYNMDELGSRFITDEVTTEEDWKTLNDRFDKKINDTKIPQTEELAR